MDRGLAAAGVCLVGATALGAVVSVREGIPGEPLGARVPGRVPVHLLLGLGSGLSAPWPMPVGVLVAVLRSRTGRAGPIRLGAGVGAGVLAGTLVEPVTWGRRSRGPWVAAAVAFNIVSGCALVLAARKARVVR
jgi:hypothetical protein